MLKKTCRAVAFAYGGLVAVPGLLAWSPGAVLLGLALACAAY